MRLRWKTRLVVCAGILLLALVVVGWRVSLSGPRAPVYEGKSLDEMLTAGAWLIQADLGLREAVQKLGGEAVPYLAHVLTREPTLVQRVYNKIYFALPRSVRGHLRAPSPYGNRRSSAASLLGVAGTNAVRHVPLLVRLSREDANDHVRHNAMSSLERLAIGTEFESVALETMIAGTKDVGLQVKKSAYGRLGSFRNRAEEVVPVLLQGLEDPNVSDECAYALKRLGSAAEPLVQAAVARGEVSILLLGTNLAPGALPASGVVDDQRDVLKLF